MHNFYQENAVAPLGEEAGCAWMWRESDEVYVPWIAIGAECGARTCVRSGENHAWTWRGSGVE